jgi:D-alanyl-lipoteichoic acid acyltransferase DltB (MBOAT superfamily)
MIPGLPPITVDSLPFAVFALGMVLLAWSKGQHRFTVALSVLGVAMILTWLSPMDVAALMLFVVPPYFATRYLWGNKQANGKALMVLTIVWEVLLFIYLKKYEWIGEASYLNHPIAIIGLSYILFRLLHLIVEAPHLGHLPFNSLRFTSYVFAFWTLLSGPIQRYEDFCGGMAMVGRPSNEEALSAGHRAVNGLIKAFLIAPIFLEASNLTALGEDGATWLDLVVVVYSFPIYLYLNFSGYTDLVIAIAKLCGVTTLPENFNRPYLARNIQDFWGRWHMSFGDWIRQYIFIPLSKRLLEKTEASLHGLMLALSVIVSFVIIGAWHGTTSNFVVFGLLHGAAIIVGEIYGKKLKAQLGRKKKKAFERHPIVHGLAMFLCFNYVALTVVLFPNSLSEIGTTFGQFFTARGLL